MTFDYLCDRDVEDCEIELCDSCKGETIMMPSGKLVLVNVGELI